MGVIGGRPLREWYLFLTLNVCLDSEWSASDVREVHHCGCLLRPLREAGWRSVLRCPGDVFSTIPFVDARRIFGDAGTRQCGDLSTTVEYVFHDL